jgi:putative ABC transport system permease protein
VEEALLARLGLKTGDAIHIGGADFIVRARIVSEPDRVSGGFTLGPHVLVQLQGLQRAGLVTPGSLINYAYRVAFSGEEEPKTFRDQVAQRFPKGVWEISDRNNALPQVRRFVQQATMFLTLVGLTALIVAGVGAGQAVEAFLERRRATIATLKAMGAEGRHIFLIYLTQIMAVASLGLILGLVLGAAFPFIIEHLFGDAIPAPAHYAVYPGPLALAGLFGALAALGFAVPPLARAREIAPAGLFRDLVAPSARRGRWPYRLAAAAAFAAIAGLSVLLSPYPLFNLGFLGGTVGVLIVLKVIAIGLRRGIARVPRRRSQAVRLALSNLTRPGTPTASIVVALGLGLTLLATVTLIQRTVEAQIEDQLPSRSPSFLFIDIQKNQADQFAKQVASFHSNSEFIMTPMLRARIVKLKGVPVEDVNIAAGSRWAVNGDRNLTYETSKPKNARIVEGPDWWPADYRGPTLVSFDKELADGMGLKIGDTMTISLLGREIDLRIFNLRDIDFRNAGLNFILTVSPGIVDQAPHAFFSSVRVAPADEEPLFTAIAGTFPNVTVVRVKEALAQVGVMLASLARGIEIASLITIFAGILVLAGAIAAGHRTRLYDAVVLKVLGATRGRLALVYVIEYGVLGACAGLAAAIAGTAAAWAVARFVLEAPFVFDGRMLLITIAGGALGTLFLGLSGGFTALAAKPAKRLRNP